MSCQAIAKLADESITCATIHYWLKKYSIGIRSIGEHMKGAKNWCLGKHHNATTKEKISSSLTGHERSKETIEKWRNTCKINKSFKNRKAIHPKPCWTTSQNGKLICMRSSWEVEFSNWLTSKKYTWEFEPKAFSLDECTYTPDFYVKELDAYFDVKGWMREDAKAKIVKFRKTYPNIKLIIADKDYLLKIGCDLSKSYAAARPQVKCPQCGKMFKQNKRKQKFCSLICGRGPKLHLNENKI